MPTKHSQKLGSAVSAHQQQRSEVDSVMPRFPEDDRSALGTGRARYTFTPKNHTYDYHYHRHQQSSSSLEW